MPDKTGRVRGIFVPRVPWHDLTPETDEVRRDDGTLERAATYRDAEGDLVAPDVRELLREGKMDEQKPEETTAPKDGDRQETKTETAGAQRRMAVLNNGQIVETDSAPDAEHR